VFDLSADPTPSRDLSVDPALRPPVEAHRLRAARPLRIAGEDVLRTVWTTRRFAERAERWRTSGLLWSARYLAWLGSRARS
jgi:hypothetical protein